MDCKMHNTIDRLSGYVYELLRRVSDLEKQNETLINKTESMQRWIDHRKKYITFM
jgi:predicted RNase H-like nuclease (RuvC/YqgF family)